MGGQEIINARLQMLSNQYGTFNGHLTFPSYNREQKRRYIKAHKKDKNASICPHCHYNTLKITDDNSKEFINAINNSLKYSVNSKVEVKAPLIDMTKSNIVKKGIELNIPFQKIYSCYNGTDKHCGKCESCLRLKRALKSLEKTDIINSIFG